MNTTSSGSCHLATRGREVVEDLVLGQRRTRPRARRTPAGARTTSRRGCRSRRPRVIFGWAISSFSSSTDEIHSPPDLIRSLVRSTSWMRPRSSIVATSPVCSQPSSVKLSPDPRVVVVVGGDPRPTALQLAARLAVPGTGSVGPGSTTRHSTPKQVRPTPAAQVGLLVVGQRLLVAVEPAHRRERDSSRSSPRPAGSAGRAARGSLRQRLRHRRAAAGDGPQAGRVAPFEQRQHAASRSSARRRRR